MTLGTHSCQTMDHPIQLTDEVKNALLDDGQLPERIYVSGASYVPHETVKAGYKGAVWRVTDEYGRSRAAKLAIPEDYDERSYLQELSRAAKLEPYPQFARFIAADVIEIELTGFGKKKFVCFIEEWINGYTLEDYLRQRQDEITPSFLIAYVKEVCAALSALRAVGLQHDDLHSGNVMLENPPDGALLSSLRVRIIDTGSMKPLNIATKKPADDFRRFVEHLVEIHNAILRRKLLPIRDRWILGESVKLFRSMLDDDFAVALRSPEQISSDFEGLPVSFDTRRREPSESLGSPFEYISAEHIADDRILVKIFADSCPWLEKVSGPDPCLVTGPRGCGKSTIFRWLSLKAHLHKETREFDAMRIAGFYISCSSDLQNRLSWLRTRALAEKFRNEIIHYFNLLLTREIVQTLLLISRRKDSRSFWGFGAVQEKGVFEFLTANLNVSHVTLGGVSRIQQCLEILELEMFRCHVQMLRGLNLSSTTPETFLGDFTGWLSKKFPFFGEKRITFLLDDFSTHRLPEPVQVILNRIIWERRATHIFKLSSEKYGASLTDSFDATVDVTREMVETDCGREYIALDDTEQVRKSQLFAADLLAHRLVAAGYTGTPENLLGNSEWPEGSLGAALRNKGQGRKNDQYHGLECIASLCSGDVSTLLSVYRRIFERGGVDKNTAGKVPKRIQHEAIESVSRELFENIKHHHPLGSRMHDLVREFGTLVREVLDNGRLIKGNIPPQSPRIEVDQVFGSADDLLSADQELLQKELVRRALFIEMEPGRSRRGAVTTLRWQLRRVFLPAFGAALSKNTAFKWKPAEFKFFLSDPRVAREMETTKTQKGFKDGQRDLFDEVN